ncbi:coniferyl alcohol acyltransferase [Daucus carota subsp. sativus]|uniref:coniferyl alcohol acyltransferase n=1 Tax=Daucus carota subsp. sativus TaxID=79200 RepID=UPI0007F00080|nr:PREDICTED: shikimate O-hydroxycinnamoyltransferase-like [Daucus carota subsp. sativus]
MIGFSSSWLKIATMGSSERGVEVVVKRTEVVAPFVPLTVQRLPMLNLDLLVPPSDIGILFCYNAGSMNNEVMISMVKRGLSQVLVPFYSLAGEVVLNNEGEPEILCNNHGVDFVQAIADMDLQCLDLHKLDVSVYPCLFPVRKRGVLSVQVTEMRCGALVICCSFDHRVADPHSVSIFLVAWAYMTRSKHCGDDKIASVSSPDYLRSLLHPRNISHPDATIDNNYVLFEAASSDSPQAPVHHH